MRARLQDCIYEDNKENLTRVDSFDFGWKSVPSDGGTERRGIGGNSEIFNKMTKSLDWKDSLKRMINNKEQNGFGEKMMESLNEELTNNNDNDNYNNNDNDNDVKSLKKIEISQFSDENVQSLLAKFNASVKALWNCETSSDTFGEFQEFQESEESMSLMSLNNQVKSCIKLDYNHDGNHGFIQCGTNITSSIWTNINDNLGSIHWSWTNSGMAWACETETETETKTKTKTVFGVENKLRPSPSPSPVTCSEGVLMSASGRRRRCKSQSDEEEEMQSEEMSYDSDFYSYLNISLNLLNHNSCYSNFMKVMKAKRPHSNFSHLSRVSDLGKKYESKEFFHEIEGNGKNKVENESLLSWNETHFRPINNETSDSMNVATRVAGTYADGTTFHVSNEFEKVDFIRSSSGALYLGGLKQLKYKEYKCGTGTGTEKYELGYEHYCSTLPFFPKYRVIQNQNEKFSQTDENDPLQVVSVVDVSCQIDEIESDFFFPGDEKLAHDIINCLEKESSQFTPSHISPF